MEINCPCDNTLVHKLLESLFGSAPFESPRMLFEAINKDRTIYSILKQHTDESGGLIQYRDKHLSARVYTYTFYEFVHKHADYIVQLDNTTGGGLCMFLINECPDTTSDTVALATHSLTLTNPNHGFVDPYIPGTAALAAKFLQYRPNPGTGLPLIPFVQALDWTRFLSSSHEDWFMQLIWDKLPTHRNVMKIPWTVVGISPGWVITHEDNTKAPFDLTLRSLVFDLSEMFDPTIFIYFTSPVGPKYFHRSIDVTEVFDYIDAVRTDATKWESRLLCLDINCHHHHDCRNNWSIKEHVMRSGHSLTLYSCTYPELSDKTVIEIKVSLPGPTVHNHRFNRKRKIKT